MHKRKWIAAFTACSLVTTLFSGFSPRNVKADNSSVHTFQRVTTGQEDGLVRYHYIDDTGATVTPSSSHETTTLKKAASLPSSYDSRDAGVITSIKDQGVSGACWAFSAIKALESDSITRGLSTLEQTDYSENHLAWFTYFTLQDTSDPLYGDHAETGIIPFSEYYNLGGNALFATFTLANWWGAVHEETAPFSASNSVEMSAMALSMTTKENLRTQSDIYLKEANCYDASNQTGKRNEIKQAVMDYGALDVSLYYSQNYLYQDDNVTSLYQNIHDNTDANHCVTIVGWDDNFNTFKQTPKKAGAWLIANSYGEDYGTEGYFWVSYYDTSLGEFYSFESQSTDTYDTNFQYDGFGWDSGYYDSEDIALANVFTNETDSPQQIEAAGFYTYADGQDYEIKVYRNLKGNGPLDGEPVSRCTTSGIAEHSGYHTISLAEPIAVAPGESFSVVVTFHAGSGSDGVAYALVEGSEDNSNGIYYQSQSGQSYVYFASEQKWYDNTAYIDMDDGEQYNMNNACIKALASTISEEAFQDQEANYLPETPEPVSTPVTTTPVPTKAPVSPTATTTTTIAPSSQPVFSGSPTASSIPDTSDTLTGNSSAKVILSVSNATIGKGESISIPIKVTPASAKSQMQYKSSRPSVAKVSKTGKITGRKKGKTTISITTPAGDTLQMKITVKKAPSSIKITAPAKHLKKGKSAKIKTKLSKGSASYQLTYRSSNKKIATISSNGKITAKKKGTVKIQVRTFNGKKAVQKIRVS